jgi:tetratricopeptide (TPR) repeat protein
VCQVAAARRTGDALEHVRRTLVQAVAAVYPEEREVEDDPKAWPRWRRLDALAIALVRVDSEPPLAAAKLLNVLALYRFRHCWLPGIPEARSFCERALRIREKVLGPEHPDVALSLDALGRAFTAQRDLAGAQSLYERALAINEKVLGPEHPATAISLDHLGTIFAMRSNLVGAQSLYERALAINEKVLGPEHHATAFNFHRFGRLFRRRGDLARARSTQEHALALFERKLGPEHHHTAFLRLLRSLRGHRKPLLWSLQS